MQPAIVPTVQSLLRQTASLLLYTAVLESEGGQAFMTLLQTIQQSETARLECLRAYSRWFQVLASTHQTWQDYLLVQILRDDNPFTRQAERSPLADLPPALVAAAQHDLTVLQQIYQCDTQQLSQWVKLASGSEAEPVTWTTHSHPTVPEWLRSSFAGAIDLNRLAEQYHQSGVGILADYRAFRWQAGTLVGIAHPDPITVTDLVGYETQKATLLRNTEFLLNGSTALHVLLYGSRGSGKSSLVKGLLHQYGDRGLRLVEVAKSDLGDLPTIIEQLREKPQKFILFVDDLSFEEDEETYKALKAVLEGNLTARPQNVVVYATSNRRHLIREFFADRPRPSDQDEVHAWDTVQEKLSFSDRFGLTLTFEPADQKTYLQIVHHLAQQVNLSLSNEDLEFRALQWATRHNGRSGRTARQFIDFLGAELALTKALSE